MTMPGAGRATLESRMTTPELCVLREGSPRALDALRALLVAGGVDARLTKATGCDPNG